jgi:NAD(P)-dependent dehydrogenase (short-subunit alcohol dehydrogenase family)
VRTAVITGSASGLGAAIRRRLEAQGDRVIGVDLRGQEIDADLGTDDGRREAVAAAVDRADGRVDVAVACAGLGPHVRPIATIVSVNFFGAVQVLEGLRPALLAAGGAGTPGPGGPAAVAISSNSIGLVPADEQAFLDAMLDGDEVEARRLGEQVHPAVVYGTTKRALALAVRRRAEAWGADGIRLNAVAPGPINTPLLQGSIDDPELGPLVDALPVPLGRRSEPDEIAGVVAFLLGPDAAYVHGSVLFADGGTAALMRPDHT